MYGLKHLILRGSNELVDLTTQMDEHFPTRGKPVLFQAH